jgi:putative methyltransferase (TIGR04325 family)
MNAKWLIKSLTPPLLLDLIRRRLSSPRPSFIWEGIYPHLWDVPTECGTYDGVEEMLEEAQHSLQVARAGGKPYICWHNTIALLAATKCAQSGLVRVLDFGGGMGLGFIQLLVTLRCNAAIEWHVVELENMCVAGRQLYSDDSRIQYHTSLPEICEGVDIVYVSGVLAYIEDYAGLLRNLASLNAPYLLLARTAVGRFPTFAARQLNLPGQILPYWFLNLNEVEEILAGTRYSLVHDVWVGPEYDQSNFPETHRFGRMRDLLFVRADTPLATR